MGFSIANDMRMKRRLVFLTVLLLLGIPQPALANNPPGPHGVLPEFLILFIMILLSSVGGAYPVLKGLHGKKSPMPTIIGIILAFLFSWTLQGAPVLIAFIFGIIALKRGFQMIWWGWRAHASHERVAHLIEANPSRLIPAGALLIPITLFLMGMSVAFVGYWPFPDEDALVEFVAYQLAYAKLEESRAGERRFDPKYDRDFRWWSYVDVEYGADGKSFKVYMLSSRKFPSFPYNYLTSQPSYRADETGQIRMIYVRNGERCPADAPVVLQVDQDILKALQDGDPKVRGNVANALGKLRDPGAVDSLIAAVKDGNPYVRVRAAWALEQITGQAFGDDSEAWQKWWDQNKETTRSDSGREASR